MAGRQFIVARGGCIKDASIKAGGSGEVYVAGSILEQGYPPIRTAKDVNEYMKSRHLEEYYAPRTQQEVITPSEFVAMPPGVEQNKPMKLADNRERMAAIDASKAPVLTGKGGAGVDTIGGGPAIVRAATPSPSPRQRRPSGRKPRIAMEAPVVVTETAGPVVDGAGAAVSPWVIDPSTLAGKGLEELGTMIAERDAGRPTPTTVEEAVAVLTQDWRAAAPVT